MASISFQMTSTPLTGTKTVSGTDTDMQNLLNWAAVAYAPLIFQLFNTTTPTNAQIGVALATATVNAWKDAVQKFMTAPAVPPAPMTWG